MKLTLSSGGGVTGLRKTHSIDIGALDPKTKQSLKSYMKNSGVVAKRNFGAVWRLEDGEAAPVEVAKLDSNLRALYDQMSSQLAYQPLKRGK